MIIYVYIYICIYIYIYIYAHTFLHDELCATDDQGSQSGSDLFGLAKGVAAEAKRVKLRGVKASDRDCMKT